MEPFCSSLWGHESAGSCDWAKGGVVEILVNYENWKISLLVDILTKCSSCLCCGTNLMKGSKFQLYNGSRFWNWKVICVVWTNAFLLYYSHFSGYKIKSLVRLALFFLWKRPESFCDWKVYKLLIMFADGGPHWSVPPFVCETESETSVFSIVHGFWAYAAAACQLQI